MTQLLDRISKSPHLWNLLRRIVEDNFRGEKALIAQELAPHHDAGVRRFLDLGCGTGEFTACFPPGCYVGVDISPLYVHFAGKAYSHAIFVVSDGTTLALNSTSFDAALVLGVLHHLHDAAACAAMNELYRVLRPGAIALVMEDIPPPDLWNVAGHAMHWVDRGGFIRSEAEYRTLFGDGFEIARSYMMRSGICDYGVYVLVRQ